MKYNIGDKVKFLNETGGGTIVKILDSSQVVVLTEYDFEIPVYTDELVLTEPAGDIFREEVLYTAKSVEKEAAPQEKNERYEPVYNEELGSEVNLFLAYVEKKGNHNVYSLFLINDSNYSLNFSLAERDASGLSLIENDLLEANTKYLVMEVDRDYINSRHELVFQAILFSGELYEYKKAIDFQIKIDPLKFFIDGSFAENEFFDEDAVIIEIVDETKLKAALEKIRNNEVEKVIPLKKEHVVQTTVQQKKPVEEIDLHLPEVIDDPTGLSKAEMLEVQMKTFREKLNEAIKNKQKRIVFIHGIGNGRLKSELRREIDTKYKNCKYQDASFKEYGYGATLVIIY